LRLQCRGAVLAGHRDTGRQRLGRHRARGLVACRFHVLDDFPGCLADGLAHVVQRRMSACMAARTARVVFSRSRVSARVCVNATHDSTAIVVETAMPAPAMASRRWRMAKLFTDEVPCSSVEATPVNEVAHQAACISATDMAA
jgi:hypothetical protein